MKHNSISSSLARIFVFGIPSLGYLYIYLNNTGVQKLACRRIEPVQVDCKFSQSRFMGLVNEGVISLNDVKRIRVDTTTYTTTDHEGRAITNKAYNVILTYSKNEFSLTNNFISNNFIQDTSKINAFIENNKSTALNIQYDNRFNSLVFLGIIIIIILFCYRSSVKLG